MILPLHIPVQRTEIPQVEKKGRLSLRRLSALEVTMFWLDITLQNTRGSIFCQCRVYENYKSSVRKKTNKEKNTFRVSPVHRSCAICWLGSFFFLCLVSILSETTLMIVVHTMSLGAFRRRKTVFPVLEDILGRRSSQPLFMTSGVKHGRCSTVCPLHSNKITCKPGPAPNYWPSR